MCWKRKTGNLHWHPSHLFSRQGSSRRFILNLIFFYLTKQRRGKGSGGGATNLSKLTIWMAPYVWTIVSLMTVLGSCRNEWYDIKCFRCFCAGQYLTFWATNLILLAFLIVEYDLRLELLAQLQVRAVQVSVWKYCQREIWCQPLLLMVVIRYL